MKLTKSEAALIIKETLKLPMSTFVEIVDDYIAPNPTVESTTYIPPNTTTQNTYQTPTSPYYPQK